MPLRAEGDNLARAGGATGRSKRRAYRPMPSAPSAACDDQLGRRTRHPSLSFVQAVHVRGSSWLKPVTLTRDVHDEFDALRRRQAVHQSNKQRRAARRAARPGESTVALAHVPARRSVPGGADLGARSAGAGAVLERLLPGRGDAQRAVLFRLRPRHAQHSRAMKGLRQASRPSSRNCAGERRPAAQAVQGHLHETAPASLGLGQRGQHPGSGCEDACPGSPASSTVTDAPSRAQGDRRPRGR